MMEVFNQHFHGILFSIQDESYYEKQDVLSWGVKARRSRSPESPPSPAFSFANLVRLRCCELERDPQRALHQTRPGVAHAADRTKVPVAGV